MKKYLFPMMFLLILGIAQNSSATLTTMFESEGNVGVEVVAFPSNYSENGTGNLVLSSIPAGATIEGAWLMGNNYFASLTPSATFASNSLGSTSAFATDGSFSTYLWDVTSLVTGNGTYSASYSGMSNSYGLALIVAFSDLSLPESKVIINTGAIDLAPATASTTFDANAGFGELWIHTLADNNGGFGQSGEEILLNGSVVGGPIDANLGPYASLFQIPVTAIAGINTVQINDPADTFGWDLSVLRTPAAVPEPSSFLLLSAALAGLGFLRKRSKN